MNRQQHSTEKYSLGETFKLPLFTNPKPYSLCHGKIYKQSKPSLFSVCWFYYLFISFHFASFPFSKSNFYFCYWAITWVQNVCIHRIMSAVPKDGFNFIYFSYENSSSNIYCRRGSIFGSKQRKKIFNVPL